MTPSLIIRAGLILFLGTSLFAFAFVYFVHQTADNFDFPYPDGLNGTIRMTCAAGFNSHLPSENAMSAYDHYVDGWLAINQRPIPRIDLSTTTPSNAIGQMNEIASSREVMTEILHDSIQDEFGCDVRILN